MADFLDWPGQSGKQYRYWLIATLTADGLLAAGGNYMFVKYTPQGWFPVYIGQADDLKARLPGHERLAEAIRAGATHAMGHTTPAGEQARLDEERDLILRWQPPLNTHHRKAS